MPDIIQLLPDSVANQIAAGEVIQRPASLIKELVENAIDAGSTKISIIVKDAGRTLVQIIDNGNGMSETDARMSFERHATSKIRQANDLFAIQTLGFRGEALASIAAVAEVTLKTRHKLNEIGTEININGSELISQEAVSCPVGSNFSVRNLFYNIPARRKFLKTNNTEFRHIITELQRISLCFPGIDFSLIHNSTEIYNLPSENLRQRVVKLFGKAINQNLVDIKAETSIVKIHGLVCKPEYAKKTFGEQFFFANNRFMKHNYFHKAVMTAFNKLLPANAVPSYFIFLDVDTEKLDVNIHPTKTEIKFEDEQSVWQILHSAVRESLGKFNIAPAIDFETDTSIEIPVFSKNTEIKSPSISINSNYNPFENDKPGNHSSKFSPSLQKANLSNWETIYQGFEKKEESLDQESTETQKTIELTDININNTQIFIQLKNKYIIVPVKSGMMIIDQKRAHERILFEYYLALLTSEHEAAQAELYPQTIELSADNYVIMKEILEEINKVGFDIRDFGNNTIVVNGYPSRIKNFNPKEVIEKILEDYKSKPTNMQISAKEQMARSLSKASAINYGRALNIEEIRQLVDLLFACSNPNYSPDGKPVISIMNIEEIEKRLK